jgi:glycosyltransferase involved in cell wall biosynthesis
MSRVDPLAFKRPTIAVARLCAWLSPWIPDRIVCCSETGRRNHAEFGYDQRKMIVIPNGFDTDELHPDEAARGSVRDELGVPHPSPLIGLVARFDAHKDHETFVRAAGLVRERFPEARYLLVGHGIDRQNAALARWIETAGIRDACHLLGVRDDVARLTAACDVAVSSSFGEGFSNAIGEAMACGVPCAVTDVGDSSWIIGDTGRVVPPRKPEALADAICELLSLDAGARRRLGEAARRRVVESFELSSIVRRYEDLYTELTDHVRR